MNKLTAVEHVDATYFTVFVMGYPFVEAFKMVQNTDVEIARRAADLGRLHRLESHKALAAWMDEIDKSKRLFPIVWRAKEN